MKQPKAAAIYARISQDRSGEGLGVKRQVADCEAEAERRGWLVAEVYVDDDVSAYSGKRRPEYQRMLEDLRSGERDAVVVYHLDRLHRQPRELEEFVQLCDDAGITNVATVQGLVNIGTGDGMLIARIQSAVAANESDAKSRRQKRKIQEQAEAGLPHGGAVRPYGYERDKITVVPHEAEVIKAVAFRFLAGESLRSLAQWMADEGYATVTGKPWRSETLRNVLKSARISGRREVNGEVIAKAVWPGIISEQDSDRIRTIFADPARVLNRSARRYLLSGLCRCGLCGSRMFTNAVSQRRRYSCRKGPDFEGCGSMSIVAESLEKLIAQAVIMRLNSPDLDKTLAGGTASDALSASLNMDIEADESQLAELTQAYAQRHITMSEWIQARKSIEQRLELNRRRMVKSGRTATLRGFMGSGSTLEAEWAGLNLNRQRAIIAAVIDRIVIHPGKQGSRTLDPNRVEAIWKL